MNLFRSGIATFLLLVAFEAVALDCARNERFGKNEKFCADQEWVGEKVTLTATKIDRVTGSPTHDQEGLTSEDTDLLFEQLQKNEESLKNFILLHKNAASFVLKLKSLDALPGVRGTGDHGALKTEDSRTLDLTSVGDLYPFEISFLLTTDSDEENEYLLFLKKDSQASLLRLERIIKHNLSSNEQQLLPVPGVEQQAEAHRLLEEEIKAYPAPNK